MTTPLLLKGFEVEMFTGRSDGTVVGCADDVARALPGFMVEPDRRNLEYATPPEADYRQQLHHLLEPRRALRAWLRHRDLTLLPGSCLSLGDSRSFERSDPTNPYHSLIERTYGTRVVTASVHLNFGIADPERLMAACRPKDGVFPEKVNEGRPMVNHNTRSIGSNANPATIKFTGKKVYD